MRQQLLVTWLWLPSACGAGVNMTGLQLAFLRAASFPTSAGAASDRMFQLAIEDSVIAKNQVGCPEGVCAQACWPAG